jgi:hypothetical protein
MTPTGKTRIVAEWTTIAVTALPPGWRNVYILDDGTLFEEDCPAILLEEKRITAHCRDVPAGDGKYHLDIRHERHDPPYETRTGFATHDFGDLMVASDTGNYQCTLGPSRTLAQLEEASGGPSAGDKEKDHE